MVKATPTKPRPGRYHIEYVTIEGVTHHSASYMGNPTMKVYLTDGREFLTSSNSSIGYAASNYRPTLCRHGEWLYCDVDLEVTKSGRVTDIYGPTSRELCEGNHE